MIFLSKDQVKNSSISVTSSESGYSVDNLKSDKKSNSWRSTSSANQTLTFTWSSAITSNFVGLCHHNFDENTNIRLKYYTETADVSPVYDSGLLSIDECFDPPIGFNTNNSDSYPYGGGNYFGRRTSEHSIKKLEIIISNNTPDSFYEISRLVCGDSAAMTYAPDIGVGLSFNDLSEQSRTEAGDVLINSQPVFKSLNFNFSYLEPSDRLKLINMFREVGNKKPVFCDMSGYKNDGVDKSLMIYGFINNRSLMLNSLYVSASSISIDEY